MIVFSYEILDDFLAALSRRISDEIFSQYIEPNISTEIAATRHKIILQFLGKPDISNPNLLVLHQIAIKIGTKKEKDEVMGNLKKAFQEAGNISLIQGEINEIMMSCNW